MSHATVTVALSKAQIKKHGSIEAALAWEMAPFDENEECFRDGSRWDWYQIGGRWTGNFDGYDPYTDPANRERCDLCAGTGVRPGGAEQFGADWFKQCNGCNGCLGKGTRVAWQLKQHSGDILPVARVLELGRFKSSYAFLLNRHWHEAERLGWFGVATYTECERKDMEKPVADPEKWFSKCLHKDEATGARVICWNEPNELWEQNFIKRFIEPLAPDTILVNVDYHV